MSKGGTGGLINIKGKKSNAQLKVDYRNLVDGKFLEKTIGSMFKINLVDKRDNKVKYWGLKNNYVLTTADGGPTTLPNGKTRATQVDHFAELKIAGNTITVDEINQELAYLKLKKDKYGVSEFENKFKNRKLTGKTSAEKDKALRGALINEKNDTQTAMKALEWQEYKYRGKTGHAADACGELPFGVNPIDKEDAGPEQGKQLFAKYLIVGVMSTEKLAVRVVGADTLERTWGAQAIDDSSLMIIDEFYLDFDKTTKSYKGSSKAKKELKLHKGFKKSNGKAPELEEDDFDSLEYPVYSLYFKNDQKNAPDSLNNTTPKPSNIIRVYGLNKERTSVNTKASLFGTMTTALLGKNRCVASNTIGALNAKNTSVFGDLFSELAGDVFAYAATGGYYNKDLDGEYAFTRAREGYISTEEYPNIKKIERFPILNFIHAAIGNFGKFPTAEAIKEGEKQLTMKNQELTMKNQELTTKDKALENAKEKIENKNKELKNRAKIIRKLRKESN